ncbi:hypothetical protein ACA910_017413 [Epithemia clementina (nom. ined.)]
MSLFFSTPSFRSSANKKKSNNNSSNKNSNSNSNRDLLSTTETTTTTKTSSPADAVVVANETTRLLSPATAVVDQQQQQQQQQEEEATLVQPVLTNHKKVSFASATTSTSSFTDSNRKKQQQPQKPQQPQSQYGTAELPLGDDDEPDNDNENYPKHGTPSSSSSSSSSSNALCGGGGCSGGYNGSSSPEGASVLHHLYTWFRLLAAFLAACLLVLQCLSFSLLRRGTFFTDDVCRVFCLLSALAFVLVAFPVTAWLVPPLQHHWMLRGFLYMFTAATSAQVAQASLYHELNIPTMTEQFTVLIVQWNAYAVFGIGLVYFVMGLFCLRGVVEQGMPSTTITQPPHEPPQDPEIQ